MVRPDVLCWAAAAFGLTGCGFSSFGQDWTDQLAPGGPCYEANLLDGLDTDSTDEAHAVFDCLNSAGALVGFAGIDVSLDAQTRDGAVGLVLAAWLAEASEGDNSEALTRLVGAVGGVLDDPSLGSDWLPLLFELAYGVPFGWLGESVEPASASMDSGVLVPAMDVVGLLATSLLDDEAWVGRADAVLRSDRTVSLLWTLAALPAATDATLRTLGEDWPDLLSEGVTYCEDASNDRWAGATGNSLRDVSVALLASSSSGALVVDHVLLKAAPLLQDEATAERLRVMLVDQAARGRLNVLPAQLKYLASVDMEGGALSGGEDTALTALVRLLAHGDQPVDCSIDLGLFVVDFSFGNLSVSLLQSLAGLDPDTVTSGVDLLGGLLGVSLTSAVLDSIAASGVCPVIDEQLVSDLGAIDRLTDPQVEELLPVLLASLAASDDHLDALVAAVHAVHDVGLMPALEGVLTDLGDTRLASTLISSLEVLVDPEHHYNAGDFPSDVQPVDFLMLMAVLAELSASDLPLEDLAGPLATLAGTDSTWTLLHNAAALAGSPEAQIRGLLGELQPALQADPALAWLGDVADQVAQPTTRRRALVLAECDALRDAIVEPGRGPVPTLAGWSLDGSLDVLIRTVQVLATLLPAATP
ncbi:MAG: hypothetical protein EXR69_05365 [Myxococcales bacterium]|nr:hypothetical protein [Myxococcales bacterium]